MSEYRNNFKDVECETIWTIPRIIIGLIIFIVVAYGIGFITTGGDLFIYQFWAPKQANAERQVHVNTDSYIQGKIQYLTNLEFEYKTEKDENDKVALRTLILHEASSVDNAKLPVDVQSFILTLKEGN